MKEHLRNLEKTKILMIGPYPPDIGGVSNFMYHIHTSKVIRNNFSLDVFITKTKQTNTSLIDQTLIEIKQLFRFPFILRGKNYEIIHIHTASFFSFYRSFLFLILAKKIFNTKCILHIHGGKFIDFFQGANTFIKKIILYSFQISDLLIVTSPSWISKVKNIIKTDKGIHIIFNGFKKEQFFPIDQVTCRKKLNLPENKKIILSIGNLISEKNHLLLINAIQKIMEENKKKNLFCIIIGEGLLKNDISDNIRNNNLEEVIINISNVPHEEIPYWINASDIMVLPSTHEGNPTVMFECLACGTPFVGTKVGGVPDIIASEDYGLLVEVNDLDDLTKKILIALDKNWDQNKIVEYSEKFSWDEIASSIFKIYNHVIDNY